MVEKPSFPSFLSDEVAVKADHLWAKFPSLPGGSSESIPLHTECTWVVLDKLKVRYEPLLKLGDSFWRDVRIALLFHDMGKFVDNFQVENRKKQYGGAPNWEVYIRHEFVSCLLLLSDASVFLEQRPDILFAVAGHHKPLNAQIFYSKVEDRDKPLMYKEYDLNVIEDYITDRLAELNIDWSFRGQSRQILANCKTSNNTHAGRIYFLDRAIDNKSNFTPGMVSYYQSSDKVERRRQFALFMGLLHSSDWAGSARKMPKDGLEFSEVDLRKYISNKPGVIFTGWRVFQKASKIEGDVLAIAPTGSGKTEASLLWACQRPKGSRIFYCLPTKVTSNAIYERIKDIFEHKSDKDRVAVVHSGAKFYRSLKEDDFEDFSYLTDKSFGREITVCTIDQLLTVNFNLGHWHLKILHLHHASIIIDEIHLYEPYTLGLIISTIRYFSGYCGCRFYLMTATMPKKLKLLLREALPNAILVEDKEKLAQARNKWMYLDCDLKNQELQDQIISDIKAGKKVLVVRNTVDSCRETYTHLKEFADESNRCCLHSRFIAKHRADKEGVVLGLKDEQAFLLVATQVVEVSLDIDFDVLYTENAPIDALIQRAGRVNRKAKKADSRVIVFRASENSKKMYKQSVPNVLERSANAILTYQGQRISEAQMIYLTDRVYENFDVSKHAAYSQGLNAYAEVQHANSYIYDVINNEEIYTREGLDSVQVIPNCYYEQLQGKSLAEKSLYQLPVRRKQLLRLAREAQLDSDHSFLIYAGEEYTFEEGLTVPSWQDIKNGPVHSSTSL